MKKILINGIVIDAYVALYAAVWSRSSEDEKVPAEPAKLAPKLRQNMRNLYRLFSQPIHPPSNRRLS